MKRETLSKFQRRHLFRPRLLFFFLFLSSWDYFLCAKPTRDRRASEREAQGGSGAIPFESFRSLLHLCIVGEVSRELQRPAAASIMEVMQILHDCVATGQTLSPRRGFVPGCRSPRYSKRSGGGDEFIYLSVQSATTGNLLPRMQRAPWNLIGHQIIPC